MEKELVPYVQSLQLKELGFNEPCFGYFDCERDFQFVPNKKKFLICEVARPTFSQAFTFFREKYGLYIQPNRIVDSEGIWYYFTISTKRTDVCEGSFIYEQAELACLEKVIEIVKENGK